MGGATERQSDVWLGVCSDCVTQDTGGEEGLKQGLERRAQEVSGGQDMLNLRCRQDIWVDRAVESFPRESGGRSERCGKSRHFCHLTLISRGVCLDQALYL